MSEGESDPLLYSEKEEPSYDITTPVKKWQNALATISLWIAFTLCNMAYSCMTPFFPVEATHVGASYTMVGIIIGTAPLTVVIMSPLFGYLLPRVRMQIFIFFGLLLVGCSITAMAFTVRIPATWGFEAMSILMRMTEGTGTAMFFTATYSIFPILYPKSVGTIVGLFEVACGLGYSLGPTFGGVLYQIGGYKLPFVVIGGSILLFAIPCPLLIGNANVQKKESQTLPFSFVFNLLTDLTFIALSISVGLACASTAFLGPTLQPYLVSKFHLSSLQVGLIIFLVAAVRMVAMLPVGLLSDRVKKHKTFIFTVNGLFILCGGYFVIGVPYLADVLNPWFVRGAYILIGLGATLGVISVYADMLRVAKRYKAEKVSETAVAAFVSGIISSSINFGDFFGAFAGGLMGQYLVMPMIALLIGELVLAQGAFMAGVAIIDLITSRDKRDNDK